MRKIQKPGKQHSKTEAEWIWRKNYRVVLFFDEADALFGKRTDVKDSHASIEIKYVLRRAGKNGGLTILAIANRTNIDKALMPRFHFVIRIPQRRKLRRKKSSTC
jgi:SpoVK/Ycf46/Vps4 family AAA+-type ATPase